MLVSFFGDCEFTKSFYDLLKKFQVSFKVKYVTHSISLHILHL